MTGEEETQVKRIAARIYQQYGLGTGTAVVSFEDLVHDGIVGLLKAKQAFKPELGVPFGAYAQMKIHGAIMDQLRKSPLVRIPQETLSRVKQLADARAKLMDENLVPDPDRLAERLGWDKERVMEIETIGNQVASLDDDRDGITKRPLATPVSMEAAILQKDLGQILDRCLKAIEDDIQRMVFVAREYRQMTLAQVGKRFGFSIETARTRHKDARESMKTCLKKNGWELQINKRSSI